MDRLPTFLESLSTVLILLVCRAIYITWFRNRLHRYPPGPNPIMFLDNVHQLPMKYQERTFLSWRKKFGDVVYARFLHTHAIVINTAVVAQDLLERRGANYSSRPYFVMLSDLMGWGSVTAFLPYGPRFLKMRKWMRNMFMTRDALANYSHVQLREVYSVLAGLLENPNDFMLHFSRYTAATIMEITYGYTIQSLDDEFIHIANKATMDTTEAVQGAGSVLADFVPFMRYYPIWLPGSGWKVNLLRIRQTVHQLINVPYNFVKDEMAAGRAKPSFVSSLLEDHYRSGNNLTEQDEDDIKHTAGIFYAAASETTTTVLGAFILAMVMYPDAFKRAQEEIDKVIGSGRLPDFNDRDSLPYLNCLIKELYRWHPPLPLGVPHCSVADDEYKGHVIPAKSVMITNIWAMSRDTEYYSDPEEFIPDRFQEQGNAVMDLRDPTNYIFGFGRRQCPGQNFADSNVYLVAANVIATMDISRAMDENGIEIISTHSYKTGLAHHVIPFRCSIRPRSQKATDLINQLSAAST